jgi:ubiquinone/menaquinone biosynthesis C-methylase UbiE
MNLFAPPRFFDPDYPELLDRPGTDDRLLREELKLLEDANERLGGHKLVLWYVQRFFRSRRPEALNILDLGTGTADIPRAIVSWARKRGLKVSVTAVDLNPSVMRVARESCQEWPEIRLDQQDIRALPYESKSFDLVLCTLALHHFGTEEATQILRKIGDIANKVYVVNDLRRHWAAIWLVDLLTPLVIKSAAVRHDWQQSIRSAFTRAEWQAMARQAGLSRFRIRSHHWFFRMALEGIK